MNSKRHAVPAAVLPTRVEVPPLAGALALAVLAGVVVAASGWMASLVGFGDPDSAMRLVEVREFLAGKGWYDLLETRLAPPAGVFMHWSRLIDLPIAGLILLFRPFVGPEAAELLAVNLWPPLTFVAFAAGLTAVVRRFAEGLPAAAVVALVLASPIVAGIFRPGRIDHHNVQAALLVWSVWALSGAERRASLAALAGLLSAVSVAIGLEMLPLILLLAAVLSIAWIVDGDRWRGALTAFGAAIGVAVPALFLVGVAPARWGIGACDMNSIVYAAVAAAGGLALVAAAQFLRGGPGDGAAGYLVRGGAMVGAGCLILTMIALAFPACLRGPYAEVDPRLGPIWLDHVIETWSALEIARRQPWLLVSNYGTALAAFALLAAVARAAPARLRFGLWLVVALLGGAIALGLVQQRSLVAAQTFAAIAATIGTAVLARDVLAPDSPAAPLARSGWILFAPLIWSILGAFTVDPAATRAESAADGAETACLETFGAVIAAEPPGLVAAPSNYGAYLLMTTPSTVLAAPYHRNTEGLLTEDAIMTADDGRREFDAAGATYLALCPGDAETALLTRRAPRGLAARIAAGARPDWLEPLADDGRGLVFRRRPGPDPMVTGTLPPLRLRPSLP